MTDKTPFVSSYLLYLLAASSDAASAEFHAEVRARGLRVPEWRVLACLHDDDGQMITRLADFAMLEQSRLSRIIDGMVARGLLERRADAKDKRRRRIHLTDLGREISANLVSLAQQHESDLLSRLSDTDRGRLIPALQALLSALSPRG